VARQHTFRYVILERVHKVERLVVVGALKSLVLDGRLGPAHVQVVAQLCSLRYAETYVQNRQRFKTLHGNNATDRSTFKHFIQGMPENHNVYSVQVVNVVQSDDIISKKYFLKGFWQLN